MTNNIENCPLQIEKEFAVFPYKTEPMLAFKTNIKSLERYVETCDIETVLIGKAVGRELQQAYDNCKISLIEFNKSNDHVNELLFHYKKNCSCSQRVTKKR